MRRFYECAGGGTEGRRAYRPILMNPDHEAREYAIIPGRWLGRLPPTDNDLCISYH
jgi:hypothetical protein